METAKKIGESVLEIKTEVRNRLLELAGAEGGLRMANTWIKYDIITSLLNSMEITIDADGVSLKKTNLPALVDPTVVKIIETLLVRSIKKAIQGEDINDFDYDTLQGMEAA